MFNIQIFDGTFPVPNHTIEAADMISAAKIATKLFNLTDVSISVCTAPVGPLSKNKWFAVKSDGIRRMIAHPTRKFAMIATGEIL